MIQLQYYLSLLTSEWQGKPKLAAWLTALLTPIFDLVGTTGGLYGAGEYGTGLYSAGASTGLASFLAAFDLDTAIGAQLDVLGVIVGVTRNPPFQILYGDLPMFGFDLNGPSIAGFDIGLWSGYMTAQLTDDEFRILIRAKIAQNFWDGQQTSLYGIWKTLFPGGSIIIQDNMDMTATVLVSGTFTPVIQALISNGLIVPRPQAVMYNYVFAELPIFGFDTNNQFVSGFDQGLWAF